MNKNLGFLAFVIIFLFACKQEAPKEMEVVELVDEIVNLEMEKDGIKLTTNNLATSFDNAHLHMIAPSEVDPIFPDSTLFRFEVENYELGVNTADQLSGQCANSGKGQHIHWILNNEPYTAHYEAEFMKQLPAENSVLLAFLSRSYHMSIKSPEAYVLTELSAGNSIDDFNEGNPHMFYSRPKGTYTGKDANKVMLDFYLINTDLKDKDYTVRASINGVSFDLKTWEPYFIEGLAEGENTIKLELLDNEGNLVKSKFNPVERTINVNYSEESI